MSDQFAYLGIDPQRTLRPGPHDYTAIRDTERKPVVQGSGLKKIGFNQFGYIDQADPASFATALGGGASATTGAEAGRERWGMVRLDEPISAFKALILDAGGSTGVRVEEKEGPRILVDAILDQSLDLSAINWNLRNTLTYSGSWANLTILYAWDILLGSGVPTRFQAAPMICTTWYDDHQLVPVSTIYGFRFYIENGNTYAGTEMVLASFRKVNSALIYQP